jgi:membrane-bound lytic murein transglycosylase D
VDLNVVASCVSSSFNQIKKLNPALLRWCTPPDKDEWILNIPKGTREEFLENYSKVPDNKKLTYINHKIRPGETLSQISQKYGVSMSEIKKFNGIRGTLIRAGKYLVIPYPQNKAYAKQLAKQSANRKTTYRRRSKPVKSVSGRQKYVHVVKKGQTLWDISNLYAVKVSEIQYWNGLGSSRTIYPNQEINIWLPGKSSVAKSESPPISNNIRIESQPVPKSSGNTVVHVVKRGDTLWDIAAYYGVSIREIKQWNNRRNNLIKPGDKLKIITAN